MVLSGYEVHHHHHHHHHHFNNQGDVTRKFYYFCQLICILSIKSLEPGHEKTCLMSYTNNNGADKPAHPQSLISVFVVCCLDSVMSLISVTKISSLMLASVAEQASLTWSETPEDMFSRDEDHFIVLGKLFGISSGLPQEDNSTLITVKILKFWTPENSL